MIELSNKCEKMGEVIIKFVEEISNINLAKKSYDELIIIFKNYVELINNFIPFLMFPIVVEKIYDEKIKKMLLRKVGKVKADDYLSKLIFPNKNNLNYYESIDFLNLVIEYKKTLKFNKIINKKIKNYLNKYKEIGFRYGFGKIWTENDIIKRIYSYKNKNPQAEKLKIINCKKQNKIITEKIIYEINASKKLRKMVKIIKEYVYLRTYRTEILNISMEKYLEILSAPVKFSFFSRKN